MAATLARLLRDLPDDRLVALLRLRPDLIVPVPANLSALAARAQSRISVARALDQLNRFQLEILDALRLTRDQDGLTSLDEVLAVASAPAAGVEAATVREAVDQLRGSLLAYGPPDAIRVVAAVDDLLGPYQAGLGRPAADLAPATAELVADPARLRRTVLSAPPAARGVLHRLATEGPVGAARTMGNGDTEAGGSGSPVGWLVSRGLLVATAPGSVELPREVGLLLRRDTGPLGQLHPRPATPAGPPAPAAELDAAGAGQAMEVVRHAGLLLDRLAEEPVPLLRTGGVGVRELRRLARGAGLDERAAALLLETGYAAGLAGEAETAGGWELRPTTGYDAWRVTPVAGRWHTLAAAWLAMPRAPGLIGSRDARDRVVGALTEAAGQAGAPALRRSTLEVLAGLEPGTAATADEILTLLTWHHPRRIAGREAAVRVLLDEAGHLGVTVRGALTSYGAALLAEVTGHPGPEPDPLGVHTGDRRAAASRATAVLEPLLPEPVGNLLVQADLTVVVPGPPEPTLAAELELVTEPESAGGASVHRVTRASLRAAFDAGYTAEDLHALFARRARNPVPQPLTYLIDDVARVHGGLRVGSATAYLRGDDEALIAQVLADPRMAPLKPRRLAPGVLVTSTPVGRVLAVLRENGYAPVPENGDGAVVLVRPPGRRAPTRVPVSAPADRFALPRLATPRLRGIVEDLRRGEAAAQAARRVPGTTGQNGNGAGQSHVEALAVLQQALRDRAPVWVGYVDARGTTMRRLLRPVSIGAGYLRAEDERTDTLHTLALHRITGATRDA
jgi:hypothetical protein